MNWNFRSLSRQRQFKTGIFFCIKTVLLLLKKIMVFPPSPNTIRVTRYILHAAQIKLSVNHLIIRTMFVKALSTRIKHTIIYRKGCPRSRSCKSFWNKENKWKMLVIKLPLSFEIFTYLSICVFINVVFSYLFIYLF